MRLFTLPGLASLLLLCDARPTSSIVFEKLDSTPVGWALDNSAKIDKDGTFITLKIHLVNQGMDAFHKLAMDIATPGHPQYGNHLDHQTILELTAPKEESVRFVQDWLNREVSEAKVTVEGDYVTVEATVNSVEKLLKTEYKNFVHEQTKAKKLRTLEYSLPTALVGHVDMVQPTTFFGLQQLRSTISEHHELEEELPGFHIEAIQAVTGCTGTRITPTCLANLYNFANAKNQTAGLLGVAGFLEEYAIKADFTTFLNNNAYFSNKGKSFTCTPVNGGTCPSSPAGVEANLDVQYAGSISSSIPMTYYSTAGRGQWIGSGTNTNEPYLEFLNYLLALPAASLPNTLSISYGDDEDTVPLSYATNACNLFSQLGARGVSILVSSGDSGVGSSCKLNGKSSFTTAFPAACPWVTTVGGTTGNSPESAWSSGGGGFSEIFGRPSYQNATVANWLATDKTHTAVTSYFNASGRAYPDISAQATNFVIVASGSSQSVSGTSCSAPTTAGIFQLLNSGRIAAGKKGLGFLNPWLYGTASSGFTDIKNGKISGCSGVISGAGFSAVSGWDPATGLGTPNYEALLTFATSTA
ncbi:tripeptidyl-peptidase 1 precursor [Bimuria novae-zelandiae CBS 107.79]|uniref:tripeptidyl-peptidase II n=1 Tax=Bimuria novae-zelandiae CBS 107.79 TaxID=1447943 RepID=A0A6A5UXZ8_9PLEO|nr:tripeptidyl-peptidase 1 precursor [Bimuria novae-zelandiae CBS 107.79]